MTCRHITSIDTQDDESGSARSRVPVPQQLERRAAELRRSLKYLRQHFSNARFVVRLSHRPQEEREGTKADRAFCTLLSSDALTSTRADFAHPRSQWRCSSFGIYSARSLSRRASPSSVRPLARPSSPPSLTVI